MKKYLLLIALFSSLNLVYAQENFNGKIVFGLEYEGEGIVSMLKNMMPSTYTFNVKDKKVKFMVDGGMSSALMGWFVSDAEKNVVYMVKDAERTAYKLESSNTQNAVKSSPQLTKLGQTEKILGYTCQKYKMVIPEGANGANATQIMWIAEDLKIDVPQTQDKNSPMALFASQGVKGFPLKVEADVSASGINFKMVMTAKEIEKKEFEDSEFEVPSSYQVKSFNAFLGK